MVAGKVNKLGLSRKRRQLSFELLESRQLLTMLAAVPDTSAFPHSATVQIIAVWDTNDNKSMDNSDKRPNCSGAMISSFQVLTAAHCLYDRVLGKASWVYAHPGRNGEFNRPFGEVPAFEWYVHPEYERKQSSLFDVAVVSLNRNIGNFTGWFGLTALQEPPRFLGSQLHHLNVLHYPGEQGFNGFEQYRGDFSYRLEPSYFSNSLPKPRYTVNMQHTWTTGGSSGSPLFLDNHRNTAQPNGREMACGLEDRSRQ